jgi:hypothetical protein
VNGVERDELVFMALQASADVSPHLRESMATRLGRLHLKPTAHNFLFPTRARPFLAWEIFPSVRNCCKLSRVIFQYRHKVWFFRQINSEIIHSNRRGKMFYS